MSDLHLRDWVEKYYPVDAFSMVARYRAGDAKYSDLVADSLVKWRGVREPILEEYSLTKQSGESSIADKSAPRSYFPLDAATCSLCILVKVKQTSCDDCPIAIHTGRDCIPEYRIWKNKSDPEPMIGLLEDTLESVLKEEAIRQRWLADGLTDEDIYDLATEEVRAHREGR